VDIRNRNTELAQSLLKENLLRGLHNFPDETKKLFVGLLRRYYLVSWLAQTHSDILDKGTVDEPVYIEPPRVPVFDPGDFASLPALLKVPRRRSPSSSSLPPIESPVGKRGKRRPSAADRPRAMALSRRRSLFARPSMIESPSQAALRLLRPSSPPQVTMEEPPVVAARTIEEFLENLVDEAPAQILKDEAMILVQLLAYLKQQKVIITSAADVAFHRVENYCIELAQKKCTKEMESFSRNFRELKYGGVLDDPLFRIDISVFDFEIQELFRTLEGNIPGPNGIPLIETEKLIKIYRAIKGNGRKMTTWAELLAAAQQAELSEVECARILVVVQLNFLPDFIDVKSFFEVFALNRPQVLQALAQPEPEPQRAETEERPAKKRRHSHSRKEANAATPEAEAAPTDAPPPEPAPE
jgi:hypothetical protein